MLSIIMPTLNAQTGLQSSLLPLIPGVVDGLVKELIIVDGGSDDATLMIAQEAGATLITAQPGRGHQLAAGGKIAKSDWMLFLHADTVLDDGWIEEVNRFIARPQAETGSAAVFRFALDDNRWRARLLEMVVALRNRLFALPYGDQGLLISRQLYEEIGGFRKIALMEDVDIIGRLGRGRLEYLKTRATTSARRYRSDGYLTRMMINARCLMMWFAGVSPDKILEKYR